MTINQEAQSKFTEIITLTSSPTKWRQNEPQPPSIPSASHEHRRFLERRRAQELGYELPLNTREAAAYVGFHYKTVERMARDGEIPAHPASGARRKTWKYYRSELDTWLRSKVNSPRHPCSPNGKDIFNEASTLSEWDRGAEVHGPGSSSLGLSLARTRPPGERHPQELGHRHQP